MNKDFLNELGELALGSRLKRVSERMMADAAAVYQHFDMNIQPKWFTLLALLDRKKQVSVVEAANLLGLTQPALSQFSRQLESRKLIEIQLDTEDSRKRVLSLSTLGHQKVAEMRPVWAAVDKAAKDLCSEFENHFYASLQTFEKALDKRSLLERSKDHFEPLNTSPNTNIVDTTMLENSLTFLDFEPDLAPFFEQINSQWIKSMFVIEDVDKQVLGHPQENIIDKGGKIWFAKHSQLGVVGACALLNKGDGAFELTKMGVLENARGLKVGEKLLQHVIAQAKLLPIDCLFLLTNAKCEAAIHLYEKNGFTHDALIMDKYGKSYQRCDVAMRWSDA
ncbi:bifunctional helix-turn-helix transcriptional regulator/GNAT family N-acetyltransferase [Aliiglaciecola sp. NS0011-25]|uniref:bifunctional helix-turn-helix transcriptional regulator/GNAT family N-acetyltransferase n=1 Tax=Aliiglaciecola sp. NS0011-25 TaxID=3127654 RepID=UPI0031077D37